ncbi:MAG TPA: hypothetical protein VIT65_23240 [Microlunatus sp.]
MSDQIDLSQFHFGDRIADDYPPTAGGDQWIRGFQPGATQIRICPVSATNRDGRTVTGYKAWVKAREHYDNNLRISYPCIEEYGGTEPDGVGCHHPDERVRKRPQKWYFNAFDKDGELHIYKIGLTLWDMFKAAQDMAQGEDPTNTQPLSERDYHIMKSGNDLGTKYFAQGGNAYPVDFSGVQLHDIGEALRVSAEEALAIYSGDSPLADDLVDYADGDEGNWATQINDRVAAAGGPKIQPKGAAEAPTGRIQPRGAAKAAAAPTPSAAKPDEPVTRVTRPATKKATAKRAAAPPPEPTPEPAASNGVTIDNLMDLELVDLQAWVAEHAPAGYELPPNMSRSRLYKVGVAILEGDDPPF